MLYLDFLVEEGNIGDNFYYYKSLIEAKLKTDPMVFIDMFRMLWLLKNPKVIEYLRTKQQTKNKQ